MAQPPLPFAIPAQAGIHECNRPGVDKWIPACAGMAIWEPPKSHSASHPQLLALTPQMPRHLLEHILEHRLGAEMRALVERAIAFGLACRVTHLVGQLAFELGLALRRPFADPDQVARQPLDRIAERPFLPLLLRAVAVRIVARRMRAGAIGEQLDQRRALVGPRPLRRPL